MTQEAKATYRMVLFLAGDERNSQSARMNLQKFCDQYLPGRAVVEIVDVLTDYRRALEFRVMITPALVVLHPAPMARIVGTLEDTEALLAALRLSSNGQQP
jgi:circadian clock protein KaiB